MTECERTALYLDGELPVEDEAAAQGHLAHCATCQAELADWVGMETALSRSRSARPRAAVTAGAAPAQPAVPGRRRRRARWRIAGVVIATAAAAIVLIWLGRARTPGPVSVALADTRPIEARLTAPAFAHHRPYRVGRDAPARELLPVEVLAALEQRGDRAGLAAAHLLGGDLARAAAALEAMPPSPARDSDLAAVALASEPVRALDLASAAIAAAPDLAAAHWNRALALRALDLPLAAAAEFDAVAARGEPGWASEARDRAAALRAPMATRKQDFADFVAAASAMAAGTGAALHGEPVRRHPGRTRRVLLNALAVARSADEARALAPLGRELDQIAGNDLASRSLAAVAARDFAVRARFRERYRALAAGKLDAAARAALIAELERAGDAVTDMRVGALLYAPPTAASVAALRRAVPSGDAWLGLQLALRDGEVKAAAGELFAAERTLLAATPACHDPAWKLVCGYIDADLVDLYERMRRLEEAEARLHAAQAAFALEGEVAFEDSLLQQAVNLERLRDRDRLAAAYLEEVALRTPRSCEIARFVGESRAAIALAAGDLATARAALPELTSCAPTPLLLFDAVDLARVGNAGDRSRAQAWIAAAHTAGGPSVVTAQIGAGRLQLDADPAGGAAQIRAGLAAIGSLGAAPGTAGELHAWGIAALISDAARRGDWAGALAVFGEELGRAPPASCLVAVSLDLERATAVVRGRDGALRGSYQPARSLAAVGADTIVPPALAAALTGCDAIAVIARPPLHGRPELLPAALPWSFLGAERRVAPPRAPSSRRVIIADVRPPSSLGLPPLAPLVPATADGAVVISGASATPARVQAEIAGAGYVEFHAHGIVAARDAAFLALSPDADGQFALTAAEVGGSRLDGAPVVVLGACWSAKTARYTAFRWSLPDAFLAAGARAVVASSTAIPDDQGAALFAELRARIARGQPVATAVAELRADRLAAGQPWAAGLIVFE